MFSFMLCGEIMRTAGDITDAEWNFFLRGAAGAIDKVRWVTSCQFKSESWNLLLYLYHTTFHNMAES